MIAPLRVFDGHDDVLLRLRKTPATREETRCWGLLDLDLGGTCSGVVSRMDPDKYFHASLVSLLRKEPPVPPERVIAETDAGPVKAILFIDPYPESGTVQTDPQAATNLKFMQLDL